MKMTWREIGQRMADARVGAIMISPYSMQRLVVDLRKRHLLIDTRKEVPYIKEEVKKVVDTLGPSTSGELNYAITKVVTAFLGANPNYAKFNDAVGALESAKLELYRRLIAPYENQKQHDNGDVYT